MARSFNQVTLMGNLTRDPELRTTPNVLAPGDSLFIPDKEIRTEVRSTDAKHEFTLSGKPLKLRDFQREIVTGAYAAGIWSAAPLCVAVVRRA